MFPMPDATAAADPRPGAAVPCDHPHAPDGAAWRLVYDGFDPGQQGLREALCTLGNGYFATRGAAAEARADEVHYPGTYVAGCYNRLSTDLAGREVWNEDLVNVPNWLSLTFRMGSGEWFDLRHVDVLEYRQELNLAIGELSRRIRFKDGAGRETLLEDERLVHMAQPHLAAHRLVLTPMNWSGEVTVRSALDGTVTNAGVARYRGLSNRHLEPVDGESVGEDTIYLKVRTTQSRVEVAQAARTRVRRGGQPVGPPRRVLSDPGAIAHEFTVTVDGQAPLAIDKVVALYTTRDAAIAECGLEARSAVARAGSFDELRHGHALAWEHLWRRFDMALELEQDDGDPTGDLRILRLHVFHLLQTASPNTMGLDVGVPARGLHGEAYRGHVFWDELFIFPLLNLRMPEITRSLLMYRHRRLAEARAAATAAGFRGAMFPWQSGSNGREETQLVHLNPRSGRWVPDRSHRQRHVNAAIAYNVWQYYQVTGDLEFLSFYGAELLLEIARFWASVAHYDADADRYDITGVMGPDEYHDGYPDSDEPGLANNAYTNIMAAWVLCRGLEVRGLLPVDRARELDARLDLSAAELARWDEVSRKLRLVFQDGILCQFQGYEALRELDWAAYREQYHDIQRLDRILEAEDDTPNRYKLSKQADVLMLFYLFSTEELGELVERLGYAFDPESIPRTIDYYLRRTAHGSTLSRVVDSWALARSDRAGSWRFFSEALDSDVRDIQGGTTAEGIHLGAMAGTVDIVQRCYTGLEMRGDVLRLNPRLPATVRCLRLNVRYRGHAIQLALTRDRLTVTTLPSTVGPVRVAVCDREFELGPEETRELDLAP